MDKAAQKKTCPVCRSEAVSVFADVGRAPVHSNVLWQTREEALGAVLGEIRLGFCGVCGHIFNTAFDPDFIKYTQEYENSLHFSPFFQDYARSLALKLIEKYDLYGKDIIEIGCGKGDFLMLMSELGNNRGVGFDATYARERTERTERVKFIQDLYSEQYAGYKGDMVLSRQVLEHIDSPKRFLETLRLGIGGNSKAIIFCEVPNVLYTIRELAIWDIIYEHFSYFSSHSIDRLFRSAGYAVSALEESFEGQFLCLEARPAPSPLSDESDESWLNWFKKEVADFSRKHSGKVLAWKCELERIAATGHRAVIWGGGSKGVSFLNALDISGLIQYAVDINPYKQGKYIPGSGQEIVSPCFLSEYRPDVIILMNPNYAAEVWSLVREMGLKSRILIA